MIPFTKAQANGNDFVIFEAGHCPPVIRDAAFIQRVCSRHSGVGADGVLILGDPETDGAHFKLDYHNSDGSWETFCANGSRCAVQFFRRAHGDDGPIILQTGAGVHEAHVHEDGLVELQILPPEHVTGMVDVEGRQGQHVDSGAPHFVAEVSDLKRQVIADEGPPIRYAGIFQPRGVNVNFFQRLDEQTLKVMTYEKGVEAVVDSCASGSVAATYQAAMTGTMRSPIRVINPGGELLVSFDEGWQQVTVTGPAILVFDSGLPDTF